MCVSCEEALITLPDVSVPAAQLPRDEIKLPRRRESGVPMATLVLEPQQSIRILDSTGRALVDILCGEGGPVLQLAGSADLDVAGALRISADSIDMLAHDGAMRLMAKDDVIVRGEKVRLN
jgi:hypothetical protein